MHTTMTKVVTAAALATVFTCAPVSVTFAAGLATTAATQAPPTSAPSNSNKPSGNSNTNVNTQILINTLNALSKPQNAPAQQNDDPTPSYQAPAPRPAAQTYQPAAQQKPALVTNAGYNCEDSLRASLVASRPDMTSARLADLARSFWETDYRDINIANVPRLRERLHKLNSDMADPAMIDSKQGNQCVAGAIAARLDELGWSADAIDRTHQTKFDDITAKSTAALDSNAGAGKKRLVLKQYPSCLKIVDVKLDDTVKNMYWYGIANTCGESVQAHWCEGKGCKPTDRAADIAAGSKEESWMRAQSPSDVRFRGTACATEYKGHGVLYDKARNECWVSME